MDGIFLEQLIRDNLKGYKKAQPDNAKHISKALNLWNKNRKITDFIEWWRIQSPELRMSLKSYLFWLWTQAQKIDGQPFEYMSDILEPTLTRTSHLQVVLTDGSDEPRISAGFLKRHFSIQGYEFSPIDKAMAVDRKSTSQTFDSVPNLDLILEYLSFLINKDGEGFLGFRKIVSSQWNSSETEFIGGGMMPVEQIAFLDYDFHDMEDILKKIEQRFQNQDSLLRRLLHIRHRAILESSLESKIITLWGFIEDLWGKVPRSKSRDEKLLERSELKNILDALDELPISKLEKFEELTEGLRNLKFKDQTQTSKVLQKIMELEAGKDCDKDKINGIRSIRGQFAHGEPLKPEQEYKTRHYFSFLMAVINELIMQELLKHNIIPNSPLY